MINYPKLRLPKRYFLLILFLFSVSVLNGQNLDNMMRIIKKANQEMAAAEESSRASDRIKYHLSTTRVFPEFELTLSNQKETKGYFQALFAKLQFKKSERSTKELVSLSETLFMESGTFEQVLGKKLEGLPAQLKGNYLNLWELQESGDLKLKTESWNYSHHIENGALLRFDIGHSLPEMASPKVPIELKAYMALMDKGVRNRDGLMRAELYTDDAAFFPHGEPVMEGIEAIKDHLVAYNAGNVKIDSINTYPIGIEDLGKYQVVQYGYYVVWSVPDFSGIGSGQGMHIWRRNEHGELRIFRTMAIQEHR